MKKALITILTVLTALLVFVSCTNSVDDYFDPPKPEPVTTKVWKVGSDEFATLQEAVDSIPKGSKVSYTTIELIDTAKGPGAKINGEVADNLEIDFKGHDFEFTGDYGLKVTNGAKAYLNNTADGESKVTLENKAADLVMILTDGASNVKIEGKASFAVENNQYVVSAKEGAEVSIGEDAASYVTLRGMLASANNASDTATDIILNNNTTAHLANIALSSADGKTAKVTLNTAKSEQDGLVEILGIQRTTTVDDTKVHVKSYVPGSIIVTDQDIKDTCITIDEGGDAGAVVVGYEIEYILNSEYGILEGSGLKTVYTKADGASLPTGDSADADSKGFVYSLHDTDVYDRFEGWYDNAECTGTAVTEVPAGETGHKTFYAKWTPAYKVTLTVNGGTLDPAKSITSYVFGVAANLPVDTDFTTPNGTFGGWYTAADFSGDAVTSISATDTGNKTFYAKWTFDVTFHSNFGTETTTTQSFVYGIKQNLNANTFDRGNGWKFGGWATSNTGTSAYDDGEEVSFEKATDLYAYWNQTAKYVGKVVEQSSGVYITPVFYSQPVTPVDGYDVSYKFYYSNDDGDTFVQLGDTVAASAIDAGNGNTDNSTAKAINTALQASISASGATADSVIYYEVVDANGKYKTNDDAYAAFYMYIPADSGVNVYSVDNVAKSAGSSFSKVHYKDIISGLGDGGILRDNYAPSANGALDENQPTAWARLSWDNNTPNVQRLTDGSIGESNFSTGRTILSQLTTWIGSDTTLKGYYYGGTDSPKSAWDLLALANNQNALYDDWFIPSFGEIEQARLSFGDAENSKINFGKAVLGADIYNSPNGTANTIITSSVGGTNTIKTSEKYKVAIFWSIPEMDYEQAWFAGKTVAYPCNSLVLVRTF